MDRPTYVCPDCNAAFPSKYASKHHVCKGGTKRNIAEQIPPVSPRVSIEFQMARIVETLIDGEPPAFDTAWRPTQQSLEALRDHFA